jgi:hypothetical protein
MATFVELLLDRVLAIVASPMQVARWSDVMCMKLLISKRDGRPPRLVFAIACVVWGAVITAQIWAAISMSKALLETTSQLLLIYAQKKADLFAVVSFVVSALLSLIFCARSFLCSRL